MTALPRSLGCGPSLYQPTSSHGLNFGVAMSPSGRIPTGSTNALIPIAGIIRRMGFAAVFTLCRGRTVDVGLTLTVCEARTTGTLAKVVEAEPHAARVSTSIRANKCSISRPVCIRCNPSYCSSTASLPGDE